MNIKKVSMGGLQSTQITPVPGVVSPTQSNTASPNKVGSQAVVKQAKAKKPGQAMDKPSQFYKSEEFEQNQQFKHPKLKAINDLLMKVRAKKSKV